RCAASVRQWRVTGAQTKTAGRGRLRCHPDPAEKVVSRCRCVSYRDPFGLCPVDKPDKNGACPGGLTVEEWEQAEAAVAMMRASVQQILLKKLDNGQIVAYENRDATQWGDADYLTGVIRINRVTFAGSVFAQGADFAFTLAHEWGHLAQWGNLPADAKLRLSAQYESDPVWEEVWENNADQHACWALAPAAKQQVHVRSCR